VLSGPTHKAALRIALTQSVRPSVCLSLTCVLKAELKTEVDRKFKCGLRMMRAAVVILVITMSHSEVLFI